MKVTNLKQQIKNPERVSIFVDGKYGFSLSLDQIVDHKLRKDLELTEADIKRYRKISDDGKLKARASEWLLNRPHSTREFKDYMYRKKAGPELTEKLVEEFTARKYLSDEDYSKWLIDLRSRGSKSNRAIKAELFKKGVSREVVEQVMEDYEDSETDRLRELIAKKSKLSRYKSNPLKLTKYLTGQGYSYQQVKHELNLDFEKD